MVKHKPVLLRETIDSLHVKKGLHYIDATLGAGGHATQIVKLGGFVLGIDTDESMLRIAKDRLEEACPDPKGISDRCFKLVNGNFRDIDTIAADNDIKEVAGVVFDLGISTYHFKNKLRGFSFSNPSAPLDMRMDRGKQKVTAADLLNSLRADQLSSMLLRVLTRRESRELSEKIVETREKAKFKRVGDLLALLPKKREGKKIHPATKVFLALRMSVNSELESIGEALPKAFSLLSAGGRLAVITFHSLEEQEIKDYSKLVSKNGSGEIITKDPIVPDENEIVRNPSARSAKLFVIEKIK